jgi:hypothetical protein
MKLKIEKQPHGPLKVELTTDAAKAPIKVELQPGQVDTVISLLDQARRVNVFNFLLEL